MGESKEHSILVNAIEVWIEKNKCNKDNICLLIDSGLTPAAKRPKSINGHVPDIFAENLKQEKWIIIGEAKTSRDLVTKRSEKQIKAFIEYCALFKKTLFILAVPWDTTRYAKSLLKEYKKELCLERIESIVINELGF